MVLEAPRLPLLKAWLPLSPVPERSQAIWGREVPLPKQAPGGISPSLGYGSALAMGHQAGSPTVRGIEAYVGIACYHFKGSVGVPDSACRLGGSIVSLHVFEQSWFAASQPTAT